MTTLDLTHHAHVYVDDLIELHREHDTDLTVRLLPEQAAYIRGQMRFVGRDISVPSNDWRTTHRIRFEVA